MSLPTCPSQFIDVLANFTYNSGITITDFIPNTTTPIPQDFAFTMKFYPNTSYPNYIFDFIFPYDATYFPSGSSEYLFYGSVTSNQTNLNGTNNIVNFTITSAQLGTSAPLDPITAFAQFIQNEDSSVNLRLEIMTTSGLVPPIHGFTFSGTFDSTLTIDLSTYPCAF